MKTGGGRVARHPRVARCARSTDVELCDEIIAFDDEIDRCYHEIERTIDPRPAGAGRLDLRPCSPHDSIHLERMGDRECHDRETDEAAADLEPGSELVEGLTETATGRRKWFGSPRTPSPTATSSVPTR